MPMGKGTYGSKKGRPKKSRKLGKYKGIDFIQKLRRKKLKIKDSEEAGRVGAKAKKAVKTKGGTYIKYEKKSASAKSFRKTFKSKCAGGASSFTWQGRSYSCAKASDKKASAPKKSAPKKSSPVKSRVVNRQSTVKVSGKVPAKVMKNLKKKV
jgi:hypothetical protein